MKYLSLLFVLLGAFTSIHVYGQFSGGSGTQSEPYLIENADDLNDVRNYLSNGTYFEQTADINLSGYSNWDPIAGGGTETKFEGYYDGQGNTISNLTIERSNTPDVGLFGHLGEGTATDQAEIRDVVLQEVNVTGGRGTGSLVGRVTGNIYTLIEECSATGTSGNRSVEGDAATGGLVGSNNSVQETPGGTNNPIISKCWADIDVTYSGADDQNAVKFGGLSGCNQKGTILNSYAKGSVTADNATNVGGLAGCILYRGRIERSFSTGLVSGNSDNMGGLVGRVGNGGNAGVVADSYWDTETSNQSSSAGGTGLPTGDMTGSDAETNLEGFDFTNIWKTNTDDYPSLQAVTPTTYVEWTGSSSTDWGVSGNWKDSNPPGTDDIAIIPEGLSNYPVISSGISKATNNPKGISIEENAQITIGPGAEITTSEVMLSSAGSSGIIIESNSTGTGSLIHHEYDLEATIERYVTGNSDLTAKSYHTVSIPLTQDANPQSALFMGSYLYEFDAAGQSWNALGTSTTTSLNVDQGYLIYYPDNNTTYTFEGPMNNGEFSAASMPGNSGDHHLVPNPYPSVIDWEATSGWTKTDLYDAIWIWSASSGNWAAYGSDAGTNGASQYIPVGQAFMVQASGASPALTMNNDVRVHSSQSFLKKTQEDSDLLRIKAMANNYSDESIIRFREGATDDFDGNYDAGKMYGMGGSPQLYSFSADNHKLSINSIEPTTESKSINLGFELDKTGEVTFEFSSMESFDPQIPVKLLDIKTNTITDLNSNSEYTFHHHPDNDPLRFKVLLNNASSLEKLEKSNLLIYFSTGELHFDFPGEKSSKIRVHIYNTNGQKVFSTSLAQGQSSIPVSGLSKGIYMIQVISNDFSVTKKVPCY